MEQGNEGQRWRPQVWFVAAYALLLVLWIAVSEAVIDSVASTPAAAARYGLINEIGLVLLSAGLLYLFTRRALAITEAVRRDAAAHEVPLALLLEQLPVVIWTTDAELRITAVRGRYYPALGYHDDVVGMTMAERLGTDDPEFLPIRAHLDALAGKESRYSFEWHEITFDTVVTPLRAADESVVGCVGVVVDVSERVADERDREATLRRLERLNDEREALLRHLVSAEADERKRIAAGIHDDSIQVITAAGMALDLLAKRPLDPEATGLAARARANISQAIERLRSMVFELRPVELDDAGLAPAIGTLLEKAATESGFEFTLEDRTSRALPGPNRYVAYQVVQESIANIRKHARARRVEVNLSDWDTGVRITIRDDGSGFDPETAGRHHHYGLADIRERAKAVGGSSTVTSAPGEGTCVEILVPGDAKDRSETPGP